MNWPGSSSATPGAVDHTKLSGRIWAAAIFAAILAGALIATWPLLSLVAFVVLALMATTLVSREFALAAIFLSSMITLGAISWLGFPSQAGLLTKGLVGLLVVGVLIDWTPGRRLELPPVFIAFAAVLVVSAVFGSSSPLLAIQAMGAYLAAPIAYLAIVNSNLEIKALKRVSWLVVLVIVVQVPIMLVQSRIVGNVDDIGGTFGMGGSTQMLAIVFGITWTVAVALLRGRKALWLVPIGLTIASVLMVSQAKAGFLFCAAGTIVVGTTLIVADPRRGAVRLLQYFVLSAGAVAALFYTYVYLGAYLPGGETASFFWIHWLSNPARVMTYLLAPDSGGQAGRLGGTVLAAAQARGATDLLIGHGLGLLSGSALLGQNSATSSSIGYALAWATSLTRFLFEAGLAGILLYLGAIGVALATVARAWTARGEEMGIFVTAAAVGAAAVYIGGSVYHAPWTTDAIAVPFWCLLGIAVRWGRLRAAEQEASIEIEQTAPPATD
jgi:hypothetical protein